MYNDNQNRLRAESPIIYRYWLLMKMWTVIVLGYWNVYVKIPSWSPLNKDHHRAYITQILILILSYLMKTQLFNPHYRCGKQPWSRTYSCALRRALWNWMTCWLHTLNQMWLSLCYSIHVVWIIEIEKRAGIKEHIYKCKSEQ